MRWSAAIPPHAVLISPGCTTTTRMPKGLAGKLGHALRLADELEGEVYVELARGRILLAQGKPKEALERLHAGIRLWPNNPGARYFAAIAAEQLGSFDLAVKEYRDSIRAGADASDAGLNLAQLLEAQGDYLGALSALSHYRRGSPPDTVEAVTLAVRLTSKTGKRGHLDDAVARLAKLPGQSGRAVCMRAEAGAFAGGQGAVVARLRASGLDFSEPANIDVLRCLVDSLIKLAATDKALKEVDQAIAGSLAGNAFQALRARVLRVRGTWMRAFRASDTNTSVPVTAMPIGLLNCPGPSPFSPHTATNSYPGSLGAGTKASQPANRTRATKETRPPVIQRINLYFMLMTYFIHVIYLL